MTIAVRLELNGALEDHVRAVADGSHGYLNVADYVEDLIRRDREEVEGLHPETLAMLREAFSEPASDMPEFDPEAFRAELKSGRV